MRLMWVPIIFGASCTIALLVYGLSQPIAVEAQSPKRFQVQAKETIAIYYNLIAICDTTTGNLLYTGDDYHTGITVVPNGCQKNPR